MTTPVSTESEFEFGAGLLCLDFANTVPVHPDPGSDDGHPDQHRAMDSYGDFVEWMQAAGQIDETTARRLRRNARSDVSAAEAALRRALDLREVIYRLVLAGMGEIQAAPADLEAFDAALRHARSNLELSYDRGEFAWGWRDLASSLEAPLAPVVESAAQLLTSREQLARVGRCGGQRCDWLFLDTTRNRSRRWCSMSGCGNRAKARRHYERKRG